MTSIDQSAHGDLRSRLRKVFSFGILVNAFTLLSNLLIPPYLIESLGVDRYGVWLYIFSIPMSLTMLDGGISSAFSTEVYRLHSRGEVDKAAATFKTGIRMLAAIVLILMSLLVIGAWVFSRNEVNRAETSWTLILLGVYALAGFFSELLNAPYKITGRFHLIQLIWLMTKAAELFVMLAVVRFNSFVIMAASMLTVKVIASAGMWFHLQGFGQFLLQGDWRVRAPVRHLIAPSLMYAVNPLIMFLALQLPVMIIGGTLSMTLVVAYTTIRTLARLSLQVGNQISISLYTEYTRVLGARNVEIVRRLYAKSNIVIFSLMVAWVVLGTVAGPEIYEAWIGHAPLHFFVIFAAVSADAVFEALMRNRVALTSSVNQHARDVAFQLGVVALSVVALYLTGLLLRDIKPMLFVSAAITAIAAVGVLAVSLRGLPAVIRDLS